MKKKKNHKYDSSICSLGQEEASILKCVIFFTTLTVSGKLPC